MSEPADAPLSPIDRYTAIVASYDKTFEPWIKRGEKINKRYRDDARTKTENETARFNILWSNVQTLKPAVYAKVPKADVSRRFSDNDPVGRVASLLIERALDYEIEHYPDFRATMDNAVVDRFLPGRGVGWVRYDPHIKEQSSEPEDGAQITEDVDQPGEGTPGEGDVSNMTGGQEQAPMEEIEYECAPTDYVHWKDFGHSVARTWEEVTVVWRWVYMSKDAAKERFKDKAKTMAFNTSPGDLNRTQTAGKVNDKAKVCELWDKDEGKAFWFEDGGLAFLDERDDPLELEGFFPCDKPLYATTTSDTLVPVPDFVLYQDQAKELDILSDRIDGLIKALRVRGVYDASQPALQRLLTEGDNNELIPVDKWAALAEKGGLKGSVDLLPLDMIAAALTEAYQAHDQVKNQIYEITGISDIVRGQGAASETATAQRIKGQYAGLRLKSMQESVALFATGLLRLKAQIICTKFQPETILAYAAASQMAPEDQQMIPQALDLIRNNPLRTFRIEVAADSLVQLDEMEEQESRVQAVTAISTFLKEAVPAAQASPELLPVLMGMLRFLMSGFKQARQLEGVIDVAARKLEEAAKQPKPDPEAAKAQAEAQTDQMKAQIKAQTDQQAAQIKAQTELQVENARMQGEMQRMQMEMRLEEQKAQFQAQLEAQRLQAEMQFERWKAELDADTKIAVAEISADSATQIAGIQAVEADQRETEDA